MFKFLSTIFALAVAAIAVRRVIQAKQGSQSVNLTGNENLQAAAEEAKAKTQQTLEKAKENFEDVAEVVKHKAREKSHR